tara:strand:+ start:1191 stop:1517 length:327 start_codon:yes stop_codon:yes gene_type:complete
MSKKELPKPSGFRILIKSREILEKTKGGIILTDDTKEIAKHACVVSQVIDMGHDCYHDKQSYWCHTGDWVLTAKYVGLKFKYDGEEYAMINDDEVLAIVPDPTKITHK